MSDPARIRRIVTKIGFYWALNQDIHLGSLLSNLPDVGPNVFWWEDAELEAALDRALVDAGIKVDEPEQIG